jgi:hypothetical protein
MVGDEKLTRSVGGKLHRLGGGIQTEGDPAYCSLRVSDLDAHIVPRFGLLKREQPVGNFHDAG